MKVRTLAALALVVVMLVVAVAPVASVSGAAFTTFNPWVDGMYKDVCKNSIINCNIYGAKPDVWLNGGPAANGLGPDGEYFFAVLVPGGQPDPNDGGAKNLSDDFDAYINRTFTVTGGEVSYYGGDHDQDSGNLIDPDRPYCTSKRGCEPDGNPPLIRLDPYADTWNPGGVYILAVCSLDRGYPVEPRDCKYDAFKVKEGRVTYEFMIEGAKFHDLQADGAWNDGDYGLPDWEITIYGTGFAGELIDETIPTDDDGHWSYGKSYTFGTWDPVYPAQLEVCEVLQDDWYPSFPIDDPTFDPDGDNCYDVTLLPAAMAYVGGLNFGNYQKVNVEACKVRDRDGSDCTTDDRVPVAGWPVALTIGGEISGWQQTEDNGCYVWTDLMPGPSYDVHEGQLPGWVPLGPTDWDFGPSVSGDGTFSYTFVNSPIQGCTPGFWQGGSAGGQAGGRWLWDEEHDPDWQASGGAGWNPYIHDTIFADVFSDGTGTMWYYINPDMWFTNDDFHKAARSLTAAYLNASWGMAYAYTVDELVDMWDAAVLSGEFLALHNLLDDANNAYFDMDGDGIPEHQCPISASGY